MLAIDLERPMRVGRHNGAVVRRVNNSGLPAMARRKWTDLGGNDTPNNVLILVGVFVRGRETEVPNPGLSNSHNLP